MASEIEEIRAPGQSNSVKGAPERSQFASLLVFGALPLRTNRGEIEPENKAIYERPVVKRGGAEFVSQGSRTSPSPSASVDLAHLRPVRGRFRRAPRNTSSEPEAQGELPPSVPAVYEALTDVT